MEIGVYTFADVDPADPAGHGPAASRRLRELVEEAELAEQVGLEVFGVGEHHRPDYAVSATAVALGAIAARTERIRLTSAVTVLSSDDPIRVFQQYATIDGMSGGRAEVMAGRGSFTESFPLFGLDLEDYDTLFATKLERLLELRDPASTEPVFPRPLQEPLPVWIAVGGNPQSVARAGLLGLPLALAIIGGRPESFAPLIELYREAATRGGHDPATLGVGINSHTYVADTAAAAADEYWPHYAATMSRIGRERGWPPVTRAQFDAALAPGGHLLVGDPEQVAEKILHQHEFFGHTRFLAQISMGTVPHRNALRAIELLGTEVAPRVRAEVARRAPAG